MPYVERVTKAGNTIEIERYFTSRYKKKGISRGDKVDCNFIDQKGADELMCLAAYLAGNEQARAEAQQKAGKKA